MSKTNTAALLDASPLRKLTSAIAVVLLLVPFAGMAQEPGSSAVKPVIPENPPQAAAGQGAEPAERLHLLVGRSLVISSPTRIKRMSIADPSVADAVITTPYQVLITGKVPGGVSLVLWNENDQSQIFDVQVDLDILNLEQKIHEVYPKEAVQIEAAKDVIVLTGQISSKPVADRILSIVSAASPKVISLMETPALPTSGEVLLEVKFAEVDRSSLSQFGFNLVSLPGSTTRTLAVTGTQQFGPIQTPSLQADAAGKLTQTTLTLSDLLNIFIFRPDINLGATIKALQQQNVLQILAEPNLLTQTGKEASFLAGGEFPFPVVQGGGAGTVPTVTIQFRQFGVQLNFTPAILDNGRIHLKMKPEVSTLDFSNALTLSGFTIPALSTRRVESEVELEDGQSFAIAGLVDDRLTQVASKIPWIGDVPILGQLFRSRSKNKTKTELLVVVTPRLVKPVSAGQPIPGLNFPMPFLAPVPIAPPDGGRPGQKKPPEKP